MRVTPVPGEHGEHRRAQNVALCGRVRTAAAERTVGDQRVEQPARLEEINEERQLPKRRHRRFVVPFNPDRTKEAVEIDPSRRRRRNNQGLFTRRVSQRR